MFLGIVGLLGLVGLLLVWFVLVFVGFAFFFVSFVFLLYKTTICPPADILCRACQYSLNRHIRAFAYLGHTFFVFGGCFGVVFVFLVVVFV